MAAFKAAPCCSSSGVASVSFGLSQSQVQQQQAQQQQQQHQQNQSHHRWSSSKFHKFSVDVGDGASRARRMHGATLKCMCKSSSEEPSSSSDARDGSRKPWDRRIQAAVSRLGGIRDMLALAGKRLHEYVSTYGSDRLVSELPEEVFAVQEDTEWDRWNAFFTEVEEQENSLAILKFELEEAIAKEDYLEASRLRNEIAAIRANDTVGQLMLGLENALLEERYSDAAKIRDETGAGLVGWWAGISGEGNDPFGKIIKITSSQGRLVATGYTARQLATCTPGVPLFEVFYRKDEELGYQRQAVYLQRERNVAADDTSISDESGDDKSSDEAEKETAKEDNKDEGLNKIIGFLKIKIPDVKLKVFRPDKLDTDLPKISKDQLKSGAEDNNKEEELGSSDDTKSLENQLQAQGKNAATAEELVEMSIRLLIGRLMQNAPEDKIPILPVRVPAKIECSSRDKFMFEIEEHGDDKLPAMDATSSWKVALTSTRSEQMLENKLLSSPVKVSKEIAEIFRLAISYAQRRRGLAKSTTFQRIHLPSTSSDAFNGLYVGTLPPHSHQVIQLRQKLGNWQEDDETADGDKFEFNEYVEAVKLVGDVSLPAGQVIFRAKTGRGCRLPHRGVYPDELGVVARYKGRGKVSEPGFKNPHWIDGELLLLDGKGGGFLNGAQLCFLYSGPGQTYLILFRRTMIEDRQL